MINKTNKVEMKTKTGTNEDVKKTTGAARTETMLIYVCVTLFTPVEQLNP